MLYEMKMLWMLAVLVAVGEGRHISADPHKTCMFGTIFLADGEVAMRVPGKCLSLVCREGEIVEKMTGAPDDTACCVNADEMYPPGYMLKACVPYTCTNGTWILDDFIDPCCGRCEVYSYSHFTTSDGHRFDWHGYCNYTLITTENSTAAVYTEMSRVGSSATVFGQTTFRSDPHTVINITTDANNRVNRQIGINGETMTIPPKGNHLVQSSSGKHNVLVSWMEECLFVQGKSKITLRYCPHRLDVWTYRSLAGSVSGLCGRFNYETTDDFTTTSGLVLPLESYPIDYPDKYYRAPDQVYGVCEDPATTTSEHNSTTDTKCYLPPSALQDLQGVCSEFLQEQFPDQSKIVEYYVPPCAADLCLVSQGDVDVSVDIPTFEPPFVTLVLMKYKDFAKKHYEDLRVMPPIIDRRLCHALEPSTTIPLDEDTVHSTEEHSNSVTRY